MKGAIFDVDGTILDTMPIWNDCPKILLERRNIIMKNDTPSVLFCLTIEDSAKYLKSVYNLPDDVEDLMKEINGIVDDFYFNGAELKPGAEKLLQQLQSADVPCVVASSTDRYCLEAALNRLGMMKYFKKIFTCGEVGKSKSYPDIFLKSMDFLSVRPEETWLFEDGLYSAKTAKSMGIKVLGVYDEGSRDDEIEFREIADIYVKSLEDIDYSIF